MTALDDFFIMLKFIMHKVMVNNGVGDDDNDGESDGNDDNGDGESDGNDDNDDGESDDDGDDGSDSVDGNNGDRYSMIIIMAI